MLHSLTVIESQTLPQYSDKCILPPSILKQTIDSVDTLPHPLVFTISNGISEISVGVKEFTADEGFIAVPRYISDQIKSETVTLSLAESIPKASFLQLKPAQFYPHITNWKYYLESQLSQIYTTISKGKSFFIDDRVAQRVVEVQVEDANAPTVIVVDTDTVLDVLPFNDIMAAQQLVQNDATSALENIPDLKDTEVLEIVPFNQTPVPTIFKIDLRAKSGSFTIRLRTDSNIEAYNVDMLVATDKFVKLDNFLFETMSQDPSVSDGDKVIYIDLKSDTIANHMEKYKEEDSCDLYIAVFAWDHNAKVKLEIVTSEKILSSTMDGNESTCSNCGKLIEKSKLYLHEAFCLRNNVKCSCGSVFLKEIPSAHWHCELCQPLVSGDSTLFKFKHDRLWHSGPYKCEQCGISPEFTDFVLLVQKHKLTVCPSKVHECMFCHLILPQEEETYEDRFTNLTHHENQCGNKTTECYECQRVLKRKDLKSHLRMHLMDKVELNTESVPMCSNQNCVNIVNNATNELGLCDICYGPLYSTVLDPTHLKLQNRIERRYMLQLTKGCGNSFCENPQCATATHPRSIKELLGLIQDDLLLLVVKPELPISKKKRVKSDENTFYFCTNESISMKKELLETIVNEGQYSRATVIKALDKLRDESKAREWLARNGLPVA